MGNDAHTISGTHSRRVDALHLSSNCYRSPYEPDLPAPDTHDRYLSGLNDCMVLYVTLALQTNGVVLTAHAVL